MGYWKMHTKLVVAFASEQIYEFVGKTGKTGDFSVILFTYNTN